MRIRFGSPLVALTLATLMTGLFAGCNRELGVRGDPRIDGVVPHVFPDADPYILGNPKDIKTPTGRPVTPTPTPATTPSTSTAPATATGPEAPATNVAPATEAGAAKPDFSSPKATVKSVYSFFAAGKPRDAKVCFAEPANDAEKDLLENGWSDEINVYPMYVAIAEKFPDQVGKGVPDLSKSIDFLKTSVDGLTEEINGDKATLKSTATGASGPSTQPISLVKVGNDWKIAIEPGRFLNKRDDNQKAMAKAMEELYTTVTADIKAGKFATMDDFKKDMDAKRSEIQKKFMPAPGGPPPG